MENMLYSLCSQGKEQKNKKNKTTLDKKTKNMVTYIQDKRLKQIRSDYYEKTN